MKNRWLFALLLTILLAGCSGSSDESKEQGRSVQTTDTIYTEQAAMNANYAEILHGRAEAATPPAILPFLPSKLHCEAIRQSITLS